MLKIPDSTMIMRAVTSREGGLRDEWVDEGVWARGNGHKGVPLLYNPSISCWQHRGNARIPEHVVDSNGSSRYVGDNMGVQES